MPALLWCSLAWRRGNLSFTWHHRNSKPQSSNQVPA